jgi:cobaltochelatase CobS
MKTYSINEVAALIPCPSKEIRSLVSKGLVEPESKLGGGKFSEAAVEKIAAIINEWPYVPTNAETGEYHRECSKKCGTEAHGFADVEKLFGFSKVKAMHHKRSHSICRKCRRGYASQGGAVVEPAPVSILAEEPKPEPTPALANLAAKVVEMAPVAAAAHRYALPSTVTFPPVKALDFGPIKALEALNEATAEGATMIPDTDPGFDLDDTESIIIANALRNAEPTWIWGPSGVGKTSGVRQMAAILRWPVYRVQMSADFSLDDFVGTTEVVPTAEGTVTKFVDGVLIRAMRNGGILLIDEITGTPPHVLLALQAVLERVDNPQAAWADGKSHATFVNTANGGEVIHCHPNFRIIVTDNTNGQGDTLGMFSGTNVMNEATRSRFTQWFRKDFPNRERWEMILKVKTPGLHAKKAKAIVDVALTSNKQSRSLGAATGVCDLVINPRDTLAIARLAMVYESVAIAFTIGLANSIDPMDPDAQYIKDLIKNVIGSH